MRARAVSSISVYERDDDVDVRIASGVIGREEDYHSRVPVHLTRVCPTGSHSSIAQRTGRDTISKTILEGPRQEKRPSIPPRRRSKRLLSYIPAGDGKRSVLGGRLE